MNKIKPKKTFDCLKMKREIQTIVFAETKMLTSSELLQYFNQAGKISEKKTIAL
jgi:hypothetical protein